MQLNLSVLSRIEVEKLLSSNKKSAFPLKVVQNEQNNGVTGSKGLFYCRKKKFSVLLQTFSFRTGKLYFEMLVNVPTSRAPSYYQDYILHDFFSGCGITSRRISFLWLAFSAIKHAFGFKNFMKSSVRSLSGGFFSRRQPS